MVAYSFKARFAAPIIAGTKTQTIRAPRKRHARPGEIVSLYTGMRTKQCKLIRCALCIDVCAVSLVFDAGPARGGFSIDGEISARTLDDFARADGFADWRDMRAFWAVEHPGVDQFEGVLIRWAP